jgi:hypothetical protein
LKTALKLKPPEAPQLEVAEGTHCSKETLAVSRGHEGCAVA